MPTNRPASKDSDLLDASEVRQKHSLWAAEAAVLQTPGDNLLACMNVGAKRYSGAYLA
jgi:hypothetical protein